MCLGWHNVLTLEVLISGYGRSRQRCLGVLVTHNMRSTRILSTFLIFVTYFRCSAVVCMPFGERIQGKIKQSSSVNRCIHGQSVIIYSFTFRPLRACLAAIFFRIDVDHLLLFLCVPWRGHVHLSVWSTCWLFYACPNFLQRVFLVARA